MSGPHEAVAEIIAAVAAYEAALMDNDVVRLDAFFWQSPETVRYGISENLYGFAEIAAFRLDRAGGSPPRRVVRTKVAVLAPGVAVAHVEFVRIDTGRQGRQSQIWLRTANGWKIASAHISLLQETRDQRLN